MEENAFALSLAEGTEQHWEEIDGEISSCSHKWSKNRISRVALSIMRLAVYEMKYRRNPGQRVYQRGGGAGQNLRRR